ncbi:MAG: hypothetical protein PVG56_01735 [Anaerolineae bacterium]|jgi:hypothetical protein
MSGRRDGTIGLGLFALLFSTYLLTFSGRYHSSDEMSMLAVTDSLARRGAWDIELMRWMGEQQGSYGPDGHLYSRKGIGTSLAALPAYWLAVQANRMGNVQAAMLTNGLGTALTGVLIYLLLRRLRYGLGVALAVALAYGLGTMAWPYARTLFSEPLAGLGLMASFYFLVRYRDRQGGWSILLASAGLGLALLARLNNAIVAPFLGLLLLAYIYGHHGRKWRAYAGPILLFAGPVLAALAISGWYNWLRFGSPLTTGYLPEERFATPFFEGLYGLTLSPGKGLFWYNPLLFAALVAWPAFYRRHRPEALLVAAVVLGNLAFYASWFLWWAGHAWGPRFLVTILPFAVLPLAPALEAATRRRALAIALGALAAASVAVQLVGVAVDFNLYLEEVFAELGLYHPATLFDPAYSPLLRQVAYVRLENLDLGWARAGTIHWLALLAGVLVVVAAAIVVWAAAKGRLSGRRAGTWASGGLLALLGLAAILLLLLYAPTGDAAQAAQALEAMARSDEAAALTDPLLTEAWQDAYDGGLWVWGVPAKGQVEAGQGATWGIGAGDPDAVAARFQVGNVSLDLALPAGQRFEVARLPAPALEDRPRLGDEISLVAAQLEGDSVRPGEMLSLALYWRALAEMDASYTFFVQALNQGDKAGQVDRLPCEGGCPTTTWRAGDLVGERIDLPIQADAPPGHYRIVTGMYDLEKGENLTWYNGQGDASGEILTIGIVEVRP